MGGVKKEYRPLPGSDKTVLGAAVSAFAAADRIGIIVIAVPPGPENGGESAFAAMARAALPARLLAAGAKPPLLFVPGGKTRRASVYHALSALSAYKPEYVLIHDGGRPWADTALINRVLDAVSIYRAVIPALPLTETPKELELPLSAGKDLQGGTCFVKRHLRRSAVVAAQTPQGFAFPEILAAHEKAAEKELNEGFEFTDDAEIWGEFCGPVAVIPGTPENRKITFPEDLV
jgi:2-C-methyl-D-erythritol 4-phosphate cytidylyltransferase